MSVVHREWGEEYIWLVKSTGAYTLSAGSDYSVIAQINNTDDQSDYITRADVTFASSFSSTGPVLTQDVYSLELDSYSQTIELEAPLTVDEDGDYYLCFMFDFGNQVTSEIDFSVSDIQICDTGSTLKYTVTPNPFNNNIKIIPENNDIREYSVVVYDIKGAIVYNGVCVGETVIELPDGLIKGIYTVCIKNEISVETHKLLKFE